MNLGSSKSLKETLAPILGENKIDSRALLKYFEPLTNWLKKDNERTGEYVGWESKEIKRKNLPRKRRRKRSIDEYTLKSEFNDG